MAADSKRPTLHLKFAPRPVAAPPAAAPAPAVATAPAWKCKPCGKGFQVDAGLPDDAAVRCPACNARLGLAGDFRQEPPSPKLRARLVSEA